MGFSMKKCLFLSFCVFSLISSLLSQGGKQSFSLQDLQKQIAKVDVFASKFNWREPYGAPVPLEWSGSAFFVKNDVVPGDGYLLTNYHVAEEGRSIQIELPSGGRERFDVETVGVYPNRDIALVRIKDDHLKKVQSFLGGAFSYAPLGDSDTVARLDKTYAVGYPLGQDHWKITKGIVSGIERPGIDGKLFIQTDAPINPGNSGGPSLNSYGEVIGVNTAGMLDAQNTGYIVPVNDIKLSLADLASGTPDDVAIVHDWFWGVDVDPSTEASDEFMGNPGDGGCIVWKVYDNSIAKRHGLQVDDKIYQINEFKLNRFGEVTVDWCSSDKISVFDLLDRLAREGSSITMVVYRMGERIEISIDLSVEDLPAIRRVCPEYEKDVTDYEAFGGMVVMELTQNHLDYFLFQGFFGGSEYSWLEKYRSPENCNKPRLVITTIIGGSVAQQTHQLKDGLIITKVGDKEVGTLAEFREAVLESKACGFIKIETEDEHKAILSIADIIADEENINEIAYPQTALFEALI